VVVQQANVHCYCCCHRMHACQQPHLQAVRWRLIKSPVGPERQAVLAQLAQHDLLDCKGLQNGPTLLSSLATTNDSGVMFELVRLISVMASDHAGRAYLLQPQSSVIPELQRILVSTPGTVLHKKEGVLLLHGMQPSCR
jgi:hypothetical protein